MPRLCRTFCRSNSKQGTPRPLVARSPMKVSRRQFLSKKCSSCCGVLCVVLKIAFFLCAFRVVFPVVFCVSFCVLRFVFRVSFCVLWEQQPAQVFRFVFAVNIISGTGLKFFFLGVLVPTRCRKTKHTTPCSSEDSFKYLLGCQSLEGALRTGPDNIDL